VLLARQLPAIRRVLLRIRRRLRLLAAIGAVLLAGHEGWELGGARPVAHPLEVTWTAAEIITVLAVVALQLWFFRAFMALRKAAEMQLERDGTVGRGSAQDPPSADHVEVRG